MRALLLVAGLALATPALADSLRCDGPSPRFRLNEVAAGPQVAEGARLFRQLQCARCHAAGEAVAEPERGRSCSGCHRWIAGTRDDAFERERMREEFPAWDRYVEHVGTFLAVPDLMAASRLSPQWVSAYLQAPVKVRPGLGEDMIRARVSSGEASAIAAWIRSLRPPLSGTAARAAAIPVSRETGKGERVFREKGCNACHAFAGEKAAPGMPAAPDLALVRRRMEPAEIAAFIADPAAFGKKVAMPEVDVTPEEAAELRDYLLGEVPAAEVAMASEPKALPVPVPATWNEVNERVFGRICVHCHLNPAREAGDGGPGYSGGFGYPAARLDFSSWAALVKGGKDGSVLAPRPGSSEPLLLARLHRRYGEYAKEAAGVAVTADSRGPGMPLGLPPLSVQDGSLVEGWLAAGAPGPEGTPALTPLEAAQVRLAEAAERAGVELPLSSPRVVVHKADRALELYQGERLVKRYAVALGLSPVGPKRKQGDYKTPEGRYFVGGKNDHSAFHRFLGLSYPNGDDARAGEADGTIGAATARVIEVADLHRQVPPQSTAMGGAVGIHGGGTGQDWTWGCIALSNDDIDELWVALPAGTPVEILP